MLATISEFLQSIKNYISSKRSNSETTRETIQKKLSCPISKKLFQDPVMLSCGHTFDRSSIGWFDRACYICQYPISSYSRYSMQKNFAAESLLSIIKERDNQSQRRRSYNSNNNISDNFKGRGGDQSKCIIVFAMLVMFVLSLYNSIITQPLSLRSAHSNNSSLPQPSKQFKQSQSSKQIQSSQASSSQTFVDSKDTLLRKYNIVNENLLSLEEYQKSGNKFIDLLSHNYRSKFKIFKNNQNNSIMTFDVDARLLQVINFLSKILVTGRGIKLNWIGQGFFMPKQQGLYFWMLITNMTSDGKARTLESLIIFQSYIIEMSTNQIKGIWYYADKKTNPQYNGKWEIEMSKQKQKQTKKERKETKKPLKKIKQQQQQQQQQQLSSQATNPKPEKKTREQNIEKPSRRKAQQSQAANTNQKFQKRQKRPSEKIQAESRYETDATKMKAQRETRQKKLQRLFERVQAEARKQSYIINVEEQRETEQSQAQRLFKIIQAEAQKQSSATNIEQERKTQYERPSERREARQQSYATSTQQERKMQQRELERPSRRREARQQPYATKSKQKEEIEDQDEAQLQDIFEKIEQKLNKLKSNYQQKDKHSQANEETQEF